MIVLSNANIANSFPAGTVVGTLSYFDETGAAVSATFFVDDNGLGVFDVSGNNLIAAWSSTPVAGWYAVGVFAVVGGYAVEDDNFQVSVVSGGPPAPPPPPPSPPSMSPDGAVLLSTDTSNLLTRTGMWTFGPTADSKGGRMVLLNGAAPVTPAWFGQKMEVANGGMLYLQGDSGSWYIWNGTTFAASAAPVTALAFSSP